MEKLNMPISSPTTSHSANTRKPKAPLTSCLGVQGKYRGTKSACATSDWQSGWSGLQSYRLTRNHSPNSVRVMSLELGVSSSSMPTSAYSCQDLLNDMMIRVCILILIPTQPKPKRKMMSRSSAHESFFLARPSTLLVYGSYHRLLILGPL